MTDMERRTFCAALSRYGAQAQITMIFEEMAELQDVLCKFLRGRVDGDTLANIAEEIADVGIMLDQMAIEFEVEDAVAEQRAHKVQRLRERMEVVHGCFEPCFDENCNWRQGFAKCSNCGKEYYAQVINHFGYCPNCGAKMDGGADNA